MNDSIVVKYDPEHEAEFKRRLAVKKMEMMNERVSAANAALGLSNQKAGRVTAHGGSTDDVLPFTADKKLAKLFKGTKANRIWEMHTTDYWDKQMDEIEVLASEIVTKEMKEEKALKSAPKIIIN